VALVDGLFFSRSVSADFFLSYNYIFIYLCKVNIFLTKNDEKATEGLVQQPFCAMAGFGARLKL
jgi:hypothetical protein